MSWSIKWRFLFTLVLGMVVITVPLVLLFMNNHLSPTVFVWLPFTLYVLLVIMIVGRFYKKIKGEVMRRKNSD